MFSSRTAWSLTPNRLSEQIRYRRQRGLPILDLTESNPTRCGFSFDSEEILRALADRRSLTYEPDPRGLRVAREAVAAYYAERGVKADPERIILTASTSEAYSYIFRLLADPGDTVLVPRPSYPLFDFLARLDDVELVPYPLRYDRGWRIDRAGLEAGWAAGSGAAARAGGRLRAILVVHPNNPTGSLIRPSELELLIEGCRQRRMAVIADEVFADYAFAPQWTTQPDANALKRVVSLASTSEVLSFTLSGLSKISALPQMKLAWIVVNGPADDLRSALDRLEVIADTYLSVSAPVANALPRLLEVRRAMQPQIMTRIEQNLQWLDQRLAEDSALGRLKSDGGWYAILQLLRVPGAGESSSSDEDWAVELLRDDGVLLHPGHFYDFPSEGHLVASLLPATEIFQEGVRRIIARVSQKS
jgi:alanine-synthesizing transaminase